MKGGNTLSFKIEEEIRSFLDKKKLKEFVNTKLVLQQILKGLLHEGEEKEKEKKRGKQSNNKMALHTYLSIITLNVNGENAPTKIHRVAKWKRKQDPYVFCLPETHLRSKDTHRLKVKGWEKIFHANRNEKKRLG